MTPTRLKHLAGLVTAAIVITLVLLVQSTSAQTANQWLFQKKNTTAGFTAYGVTPISGRAFGLDGSGNPAMLSISGGSGLENILSSVTGDTLTFTGTLTAGRILTIRDSAGTVALLGDLSSYQPLDGNLTGIANAASAAGVLTDNGSSSYSYTATTTGGNGSNDGGKIPKLNARGGLNLGGSAGSGNVFEVVSSTASFAIEGTTSVAGGIAIHATPNGADTSAFGTHLTAGSQMGFQIDGSLGTSTSTGIFAYMSGPILIAADDSFAEQISIWASGRKVRFTASDARAASYIDLTSATPTGARTITLPDASGTVSLLGSSIDLTSEVTGTLPLGNGGTGQTTASAARLALLPSITGNGGKFLRVNAGASDYELATISGGGDALTSGTLGQFAATTSAQLRGVLSDESGTGEFLTTNGSAASLTSFPTLNQSTTGNAATATALATGRTLAITGDLTWTSPSFNGSANVTAAGTLATVATAGTTGSSTAIPVITINAKGLTTGVTTAAVIAPAGTLTGTTLASGVTASSLTSAAGGTFGTAAFTAASAYEVPLTFGTGLTRTTNTVTVNTSQNIATLSNLTTNGLVTTSGGNGTLSVDTTTKTRADRIEIGIAISDETTAITTGAAKATFRMPCAMTVTEVRLTLTTASSSGLPTVDINEAGASIISTKLTCDASEKTSTTAATAAVISDSALADDAEITLDIDTAGTGATGAKVWIIGTR